MWNQGRPVLSVPASGVRHQSMTFDRRPNTALTGPRLRLFLFERHRQRFLAKWGPAVRGLAPPPPDAEPESIRTAVQAALPHTRERAEQVRSGSWKPSGRAHSAERPYSGIANPVLEQGDGAYAVAAEVEEALNVAEQGILGDYCRWLAHKEEEASDQLLEAHRLLHQRQQEMAALQTHAAELQRRHQELALTLDRIVHGNTWRLRALVKRALRGPRATAARARLAARGRIGG